MEVTLFPTDISDWNVVATLVLDAHLLTSRGLVGLATAIVVGGEPDAFDLNYPGLTQTDGAVRHPYTDHVWLGVVGPLRALPAGIPDHIDAVVSLYRVADEDIPTGIAHIDV